MTAAARRLQSSRTDVGRPVVLVVDDEPQILESLEDLLEDEFEVLTASRGEQALTLLQEYEVSVLLTDQRMPGVTGDELVRRARDASRATRVLVTGYSDMPALVRAVNDGQIYAYVSKPWKSGEMKLLVQKAADHYHLVRRFQEQNQLLDRLMEQFPDHIYFKDSDGRFCRANRSFAAQLGVDDPGWLEGRTQAEFPDEFSRRAHQEDLDLMARRAPILDRVELRDQSSGEPAWWSVTKLPLSGLGMVCVARDVTERRRTALEREMFFTNSLDLLIVSTWDGRCTQVNPAWERLLGWSREELCSRPILDFVHPEDREATQYEWDRLLSDPGHRLLSFENRYLHRDGSVRWLLWTAVAVSEDERIYAAARDITVRKEIEERLLTQARQQQCLAGLGQLAIRGVDLQELCEEAVELVCKHLETDRCTLFSLTPDQVLHRVATSGSPVGFDERLALAQAPHLRYAVSEGGLVVSDDFRTEQRFDPGPFIRDARAVSGAAVVVKDPEDKPWGVLQILSLEPRTFRQEDVHFLEMISNLLSLAVRKRTAEQELELSRQQLARAQKLEAIGQMAGGIAHDFNNILTIVLGNAEHLPPGEEAAEILDAVHKGQGLIGQLMTFARQQVVQPCPVELNQVFLRDRKLLARLVSEEVELEVVPATRPAWAVIDPSRLTQVLTNLVVNARDAMTAGGALTITVLEPGPSLVGFEVRDTGSGMSPDILHRVFEPFFTTKPTGKGTGLGLATCYGIVNQAGGTMEVTSALGQGTTFRITLPAAAEPSAAAVSESGGRLPRQFQGTVLVVDDQPSIVRLVARTLRRRGLTVVESSHPEQAPELARNLEDPLVLLVTDMVMPRMSGVDLASRVREAHPGLPVIFMTGYSDRLEDPEARDGHLLVKPFSNEDLLQTVRRALKARD